MSLSAVSRREFLRRSARFGAYGAAAPLAMNLAALGAAAAQQRNLNDYRALVCIFLYGGNDAHNTLPPQDADTHARYLAAPGSLAVPRDGLADLVLDTARPWPGTQAFALHPALAALHPVFEAGQLALVMKVGTLIRPVSKADYLAQRNLPPKLMSHNDQFSLWQTLVAEGAQSGWGGRMGDLLAAAGPQDPLFTAISVDVSSAYSSGTAVDEFMVGSPGPVTLLPIPGLPGSDLLLYQSLTRTDSLHLMDRELSRRTVIATEGAARLNVALANVDDQGLPATPLGAQLNMVARLMAVREALGLKRQTFFVSLSGFDSHSALSSAHPALLGQLGEAMAAFQTVLARLGLSESVTTFTASDFGRALTVNGDGVDHGWAGHHVVMGGSVQARQWVGEAPGFHLGDEEDIGQGRLLPAISVDQLGATLATWMGVADTDLATVFPNIGNFDQRTLPLMM